LLGPQKWTYYQLYVIVDVYSRYVVGWRLEHREDAVLAEGIFANTIADQRVDTTMLTVHADSGPGMKSKTLNQLFMDLGITLSHSRPHVSNDNPFIESLFKTLKYGATYPGYFANIYQAREFCDRFFAWYNNEHRHSGIALYTPADVHYSRIEQRRVARQSVLSTAYKAHPE
jgi:putative transposase